MTSSFESNDCPALQLARETWKSGQTDLAVQQFQKAVEDQPKNFRALLECATALGKRYRISEAAALAAQARGMAAQDPQMLSAIARVQAGLCQLPDAVRCLESIPEGCRTPLINGELAVYYEQLGRLNDAEETINRSIDEAPDPPEPQLILARVLAHQGEFERAHSLLTYILRRADLDNPLLRIRGLYQLGMVLDQFGEFEKAVEAVEQAKAMQKRIPQAEQLAKSAMKRNARLAQVYRRVDADTIRRWLNQPLPVTDNDVMPAHLIGFPRSGTTLLEQPLDAHPQVVISSERLVFADEILPELLVSDQTTDPFDVIDKISGQKLAELRERYLRCLSSSTLPMPANCVLMDKKPANTAYLFGLLRLLPESRFIVAIRDPRDVIVSCYLRYFPLTDMSACFLSWGTTIAIYAQIIEFWIYMRQMLPSTNWTEARYENVCQDIVGEANRIHRFLSLQPDPNVARYLENTQHKYVHSPTFAEVRRPVHSHSVGRWRHYEKQLQPFIKALYPYVSALDYDER